MRLRTPKMILRKDRIIGMYGGRESHTIRHITALPCMHNQQNTTQGENKNMANHITTKILLQDIANGIDARYYPSDIKFISISNKNIRLILPCGNEFIISIISRKYKKRV